MRQGGADNISYIDCDGNLVTGVTVPFLETICAHEIITPGCSNLIDIGLCAPCEPCCLPEVISATTSTEPPPEESGSGESGESGSSGSGESGSGSGGCVPIGTFDFILPDAALGVPYEYRQSLDVDGATPPFDIVIIDIPSWMSITVDPDTNEVVFSGTPDASGESNVFFNVTNCEDGLMEVGTFIFVDESGATANAGDDIIACAVDGSVVLSGSIGGTADNSIWTTFGDGTFDDATLLNATYTFGSGDIAANMALLRLTAYIGATPVADDDTTLFIVTSAIATFDYTVPNASEQYCRCEPSNPACVGNPISPNFTGGGFAGTFTGTAGLLFFDTGASPSPTGQVDIANTPVGTYTVTNTVDTGCGDPDVDTATIEILPLPEVIVEYPPGTFTTSDGDQSPVTTGSDPGIFFSSYSATPAGLTINASTGVISPSTSSPGTYTVTRIATTAFCPNSKTTFVIIT